jgi:hypothetical protein
MRISHHAPGAGRFVLRLGKHITQVQYKTLLLIVLLQNQQILYCSDASFMLLLVAFCLDYWLRPYEPPLVPRDAL